MKYSAPLVSLNIFPRQMVSEKLLFLLEYSVNLTDLNIHINPPAYRIRCHNRHQADNSGNRHHKSGSLPVRKQVST
jgi:hypothetical protein